MRFQCDKGHLFHYTAKQTHFLEPKELVDNEDTTIKVSDSIESSVCPFCFSKFVSEVVEPAPIQEAVSNVYVYDLTSGAQTELDKLLAQGYRIVSCFSKQYHLEKPKEVPAAGALPEKTEAS
jgi:hypothetical protein